MSCLFILVHLYLILWVHFKTLKEIKCICRYMGTLYIQIRVLYT